MIGYEGPMDISSISDYEEINEKLLEIKYESEKHDIVFETLNKYYDYDFFEIIEIFENEHELEVLKTSTSDPKLEIAKKIIKKNGVKVNDINKFKETLFQTKCFLNPQNGVVIYVP